MHPWLFAVELKNKPQAVIILNGRFTDITLSRTRIWEFELSNVELVWPRPEIKRYFVDHSIHAWDNGMELFYRKWSISPITYRKRGGFSNVDGRSLVVLGEMFCAFLSVRDASRLPLPAHTDGSNCLRSWLPCRLTSDASTKGIQGDHEDSVPLCQQYGDEPTAGSWYHTDEGIPNSLSPHGPVTAAPVKEKCGRFRQRK